MRIPESLPPCFLLQLHVKVKVHLFSLERSLTVYWTIAFFLQHTGSLVAACELLVVAWGSSSLIGIKPGPPALGAWSLSHWTNREDLRHAVEF